MLTVRFSMLLKICMRMLNLASRRIIYFLVTFHLTWGLDKEIIYHHCYFTLASTINMFFIDKINTIKMEFPLLEACLPVYSFVDIDIIMPACTAVFDTFHPLSCDVLSSLISNFFFPWEDFLFKFKKNLQKKDIRPINTHT